MEHVSRGFKAAINIRRCVALKTRPEKLTRADFVRQPLMLEMCKEKLKSVAGDGSKMAGRRL